jgi:hypothetical protein
MSEKNKKMFNCEFCDRSWNRRYEYERHVLTSKHDKMRQKSLESRESGLENIKTRKIKPEKTILINYCCDYCQVRCKTKKDAEKHRNSKQHIQNENKEEDFLEIVKQYTCVKCDKCYDIYASCWKHLKTCQGKPTVINSIEQTDCSEQNVHFEMAEEIPRPRPIGVTKPTISNTDLETLKKEIYKEVCDSVFGKILENNQIMMEKMTETMTQTQSLIQSNNHNQTFIQNNNTTNNTTNNHCTMNVFLNEKCKDAMNMFDFISNMNITFDHLYHQADHGFQKGLTNIMLDNLKLLSVYNRPIHFTDLKREIMYIKDNDEWTKHEDKEKLVEALEWAAKQGINSFVDWREATSAENESLESPTGQMWMKLMQTVIQPYNDRMKAYPKIMKEIARNVHLRKEDQT